MIDLNDDGMTGRMAVVGNAPQTSHCGHLVDAADYVVRFNNPFGYGGTTGTALHELFLVNCGGQMRQWLDDRTLIDAAHVRAARNISFPIHVDVATLYPAQQETDAPKDPDGIDYAEEAAEILGQGGQAVRTVPFEIYLAACDAIGLRTFGEGLPVPSSGYIGLFDIVNRAMPTAEIHVFGFGFEGWDGHDWAAERGWTLAMADQGRIVFHPV